MSYIWLNTLIVPAVSRVETVVLNPLDKPQLGAGECAITLSGSALGGAIFDATGARIRQIPFTPARVLSALQSRA